MVTWVSTMGKSPRENDFVAAQTSYLLDAVVLEHSHAQSTVFIAVDNVFEEQKTVVIALYPQSNDSAIKQ